MKRIVFLCLASFCFAGPITVSEPPRSNDGYIINFNEVNMAELVRFVAKIAKVNFIYDERALAYPVDIASGKPASPDQVLELLLHLLDENGHSIETKNGYFVIKEKEITDQPLHKQQAWIRSQIAKADPNNPAMSDQVPFLNEDKPALPFLNVDKSALPLFMQEAIEAPSQSDKFHIYKLQYHEGPEILDTIKQIAHQIQGQPGTSPQLLQAIETMQWVKATNSVLFSGPTDAVAKLNELIESLDTPLRQVFIEVLVVETGVRGSLDFGVDWAAGGKIKDNLGFGLGEVDGAKGRNFAKSFQSVNASNSPTGPNQTPLGRGFDLSIIGDIILHKGKTFFSLGSLVSALETDNGHKILLNQKIITQDNKPSSIFMGENIPYTGSTVETIGTNQQTTANIEYRDVGVSLNIRPRLGREDIITLEISEEISQAEPNRFASGDRGGILTSKTNMLTNVHVPDQSFLVLSGMVKNTETKRKSGVPFLRRLPIVGSLFGKKSKNEDKKAILIFVRPQIVDSIDEYKRITKEQQAICTDISQENDFSNALQILQDKP